MNLSPLSRLRRAFVALAVLLLSGLVPTVTSGGVVPANAAEPASRGYWLVASDGGIFAYGGAKFFGSTGAVKLNMPIVGMAATPSGNGYWLVASDGGIFAFGDAGFFGSTGGIKLNKPIVGMAATPSGSGYWLVASDGGIFSFGDAPFVGSTGGIKLNKPITGMTPSATGKGYRMVASDGGIFSFGDAAFYGSAGGTPLTKPIAGMAPTPSGKGYWMVGSDGAILPYGDAAALGSATALRSVAAMAPTPTGAGYWAVGADGSLAAFGDAADLGRPAGTLAKPIVGMAVLPSSGAPVGSGGSGSTGGTGTPGPGATPTTTVTTVPPAGIDYPLYSSLPVDGTFGTTAQVGHDPSHPLREPCYEAKKDECTLEKWHNARFAEELRSIAVIGNRVFIGGFFHQLIDHATPPPGKPYHKPVAFLAELDARTGKPAADWTFTENAAPDASVAAMAISPDGRRLYIGGRFMNAGGGRAGRLAALDLQTGLLDPTFNPPDPDGTVYSIWPHGDRVYIGGGFLKMGDKAFPGVAALNASDGTLVEGWTPPPNYGGSFVGQAGDPTQAVQGVVDAVAVTRDGKYLMVGGDFLHLGTRPEDDKNNQKSGLVALNASDGSLADWRPHNNRPVFDIEMSHDGELVLTAQGGGGGALVAHRPGQEERVFLTHVDGDALTLAVTDDRIYFGGHFDVVVPDPNEECLRHIPVKCFPGAEHEAKSAVLQRHLAAFFLDGRPDPSWTAQVDTEEGATVMAVGPDGLYLGGNFFHTLDKHFKNGGTKTWRPGFALFPPLR
ncbi:MAG TPA: hypothetical protein VEG38_01380 [Acidimicrobiia bacterium]|nr:hypothetical protein [Acidimicrobiia bacterium]